MPNPPLSYFCHKALTSKGPPLSLHFPTVHLFYDLELSIHHCMVDNRDRTVEKGSQESVVFV